MRICVVSRPGRHHLPDPAEVPAGGSRRARRLSPRRHAAVVHDGPATRPASTTCFARPPSSPRRPATSTPFAASTCPFSTSPSSTSAASCCCPTAPSTRRGTPRFGPACWKPRRSSKPAAPARRTRDRGPAARRECPRSCPTSTCRSTWSSSTPAATARSWRRSGMPWRRRPTPSRFFIHCNDNNLSLVPRFLGKERAVRHVMRAPPRAGAGADDRHGRQPDRRPLPGPVRLPDPAARLPARPAVRQARSLTPSRSLMFSGSYDPDDVTFLLKPVRLEPTAVAEKERLIQSGRRHYSEMISREGPALARLPACLSRGAAPRRGPLRPRPAGPRRNICRRSDRATSRWSRWRGPARRSASSWGESCGPCSAGLYGTTRCRSFATAASMKSPCVTSFAAMQPSRSCSWTAGPARA